MKQVKERVGHKPGLDLSAAPESVDGLVPRKKRCTWCYGQGHYWVDGKAVKCMNPDSHGMRPRLAAMMAPAANKEAA